MQRNTDARCENCPQWTSGDAGDHKRCQLGNAVHGGALHTGPRDVCVRHPNYWGFESAVCGTCLFRTDVEGGELACRWNDWTPAASAFYQGRVTSSTPACPRYRPEET
jgi:hypothetical protein